MMIRTKMDSMWGCAGRSPRAVRSGRAAFTLVELLVVVSIIALLISILLPSLKKAREQAKVAVCTSNLKGMASSSLTYAAGDRTESAIPVHPLIGLQEFTVGWIEFGGKSGQGEPLTGNNPVDSRWGTANGRGPSTRPMNDVLFKGGFTDYMNNRGPQSQNWIDDYTLDLRIYKCPSDRGYTGHHFRAWENSGLSSYDHYGNSYATNSLWVGVRGANCKLESNSPFLRPVSRIPNPANTVLYTENCGKFGWRVNYGGENDGGCQSLSGDLGADVDSVIKGWHGRPWRFVVSFADAHAAMIKMNGHQQPEPHLSSYPDDCGFGPDNAHACWRCVILRGPGWQIDTLPSPTVRTEIDCGGSGVPVNPIG